MRLTEEQYAILTAPRADPAIATQAVGALKRIDDRRPDPKAWAHRLKARHEAGERLNAYQVACYRQTLRADQ